MLPVMPKTITRTVPHPKVGFYGCNNRVVRLSAGSDGPVQMVKLDCPACGHHHKVRPFWRVWIEQLDADKKAIPVDETLDSDATVGR